MSIIERLRSRFSFPPAVDSAAPAPEPPAVAMPDQLPPVPSPHDIRAAVATTRFTDRPGSSPASSPADMALLLLAVARDGDADLRAIAVAALDTATPRWWTAVDHALRSAWRQVPTWSAATADHLATGEPDLLTLVLAGCHPDGRVRQAALGHLVHHADPSVGFVLALRSVDWVPQVRRVARRGYERLLAGADMAAWVASAGLGFSLRGRADGGWLSDRLTETLRSLPADRTEPLLHAAGRPTRRAAYQARIDAGDLSVAALTTAAVKDQDQRVRLMCARAAVARVRDDSAVLESLLTSPTAIIRAEALILLSGRDADELSGRDASQLSGRDADELSGRDASQLSGRDADELSGRDAEHARAALADRHPLVRAVAQLALRDAGHDPAAAYRSLLATGSPSPGALAGLGETGDVTDIPILSRALTQPRARVRAEAIRALRRLGGTPADTFVPLLRDPSGQVTRQAVSALRGDGRLDPAMLAELLFGTDAEPNPPAHIRVAGYRLLIAADVWLRLATNLRLVEDADPWLRQRSGTDIALWLDRQAATAYRGPGPERAAELDELLGPARAALGDGKVALIRFHAGLEHR